ncbi:hypothetical protein SNE35_09370 [Paucibacter sp. R3-3]|uniref:Uncharacterized protein n=1 Tax=Roseateles agri TaxID=3098619 RepID=A0ABU5DHW5_9BURK|nr:hypothetical protein [Paucibacter sp. R3-3]MDY0744717.1 hypothetical protein [Paucibacter sp. R3-3]
MDPIKALRLSAVLLLCAAGTAQAQSDLSAASSGLSLLPVAVSVGAAGGVLAAGSALVVVSVTVVAEGTVWVLERVSDGVRFSVRVTGQAVGGASVAVGTACVVTATVGGQILSAAGRVIAFIPNEIGERCCTTSA